MTDVLIVGAGPAGSTLALQLVRAGADVALLERARFPRTKVCGEYLSPGALAALERLGLLEIVSARAHRIRSVLLAASPSEQLQLALPDGGALALPRAELDSLLLDAATSAGARHVHGSYVASEEKRDAVIVTYRDANGDAQTLDARVLVGADGAWSMVAQRSGMAGARRRGGRWAVGGHLRDQPDSDVLEMYVGAGGYYARNPLGRGLVNAMLVMPRPIPETQCDEVVASLSGGSRRFENEKLERRVAVGPLRYMPGAVAQGRVVLTGDAAGLLDPFVGQGVALAVELSGAAAGAVRMIMAGADPSIAAHGYARARRSAMSPQKKLIAAVDMVIRVPILRRRALRRVRNRPALAESLLAAVAGSPADAARLGVRRLLALIA